MCVFNVELYENYLHSAHWAQWLIQGAIGAIAPHSKWEKLT